MRTPQNPPTACFFGTICQSAPMDSDSILSATATAPALDQGLGALTRVEPWKVSWKQMLVQRGLPTLRYLLKTESHTFAFSVAANAILSFFPFIFLLMWLVRNVFHSQAMLQVVDQLVRDHLPVAQGFVVRNLGAYAAQAWTSQRLTAGAFRTFIIPASESVLCARFQSVHSLNSHIYSSGHFKTPFQRSVWLSQQHRGDAVEPSYRCAGRSLVLV